VLQRAMKHVEVLAVTDYRSPCNVQP